MSTTSVLSVALHVKGIDVSACQLISRFLRHDGRWRVDGGLARNKGCVALRGLADAHTLYGGLMKALDKVVGWWSVH